MKAALRLDIGMAHQIADLRFFPADIAFSAHDILPRHLEILRASGHGRAGTNEAYIPMRTKRQAIVFEGVAQYEKMGRAALGGGAANALA
jgi:hypothetical protein